MGCSSCCTYLHAVGALDTSETLTPLGAPWSACGMHNRSLLGVLQQLPYASAGSWRVGGLGGAHVPVCALIPLWCAPLLHRPMRHPWAQATAGMLRRGLVCRALCQTLQLVLHGAMPHPGSWAKAGMLTRGLECRAPPGAAAHKCGLALCSRGCSNRRGLQQRQMKQLADMLTWDLACRAPPGAAAHGREGGQAAAAGGLSGLPVSRADHSGVPVPPLPLRQRPDLPGPRQQGAGSPGLHR